MTIQRSPRPAHERTETDRELPTVTGSIAVVKLLFSMGELKQVRRPVTGSGVLIGRAVAADRNVLLAADRRASAEHARIVSGPLSVTIEDLDSKNGTFVNGVSCQSAPLRDGDIIRVGNSLLLLRNETSELHDAPDQAEVLHRTILGCSPAVQLLRHQLYQAATARHSVLLHGETGTGKELAAQALSTLSGRPGDFVAVNCAAITASLAESLLFGHIAGAFSDAKKHKGYFACADRGTLFLDELGELPLAIQAKLLRAVEQREIWPVGASAPLPCDVRFVAATNRDLLGAIAADDFRRDLHERLATLTISIPPLRSRQEDILPLFLHFLGEPNLSARLGESLLLYPWPGNIRSLIKLTQRIKTFLPKSGLLDLPQVQPLLEPVANPAPAPSASAEPPPSAPRHHHHFTPEFLERIMTEQQGVRERAAEKLGISRRQLSRWLTRFQINAKDFRRS